MRRWNVIRASESTSARKAMRSVGGRRRAHREMSGWARAGTGGRRHRAQGDAEGIVSPSFPIRSRLKRISVAFARLNCASSDTTTQATEEASVQPHLLHTFWPDSSPHPPPVGRASAEVPPSIHRLRPSARIQSSFQADPWRKRRRLVQTAPSSPRPVARPSKTPASTSRHHSYRDPYLPKPLG